MVEGNGPYRLPEDLEAEDLVLEKNNFSWNNMADVLYIDQPYCTGYSTCNSSILLPKTGKEITDSLLTFLSNFTSIHPEYKHRDLYLTGHEFAGHFLPTLSLHLLNLQSLTSHPVYSDTLLSMRLKALLMGGAHIEPSIQDPTYLAFAMEKGLVGITDYQISMLGFAFCRVYLGIGWKSAAEYACKMSLQQIMGVTYRKFNPYNFKQNCEIPENRFCHNWTRIHEFYAREDVRRELGVGEREWNLLEKRLVEELEEEDLVGYLEDLKTVLGRIKVYLYYGDMDFISNWEGGFNVVKSLGKEYEDVFKQNLWNEWYLEGNIEAEYITALKMTFVRIYNSGHFEALDHPAFSFTLLNRVISS